MSEHINHYEGPILDSSPLLRVFLSPQSYNEGRWSEDFVNELKSVNSVVEEHYGDHFSTLTINPLLLMYKAAGLNPVNSDEVTDGITVRTLVLIGFQIGGQDIETDLLGWIVSRLAKTNCLNPEKISNVDSFVETAAIVEGILGIGEYLKGITDSGVEIPDVFKKFLKDSDLHP